MEAPNSYNFVTLPCPAVKLHWWQNRQMTVFVSNWGIHMSLTLCLISSMFQQDLFAPPPARRTIGIPDIVRTIAEHSARPRYTCMVIDLISRVARANGQADDRKSVVQGKSEAVRDKHDE